jgi:hypothetical protein
MKTPILGFSSLQFMRDVTYSSWNVKLCIEVSSRYDTDGDVIDTAVVKLLEPLERQREEDQGSQLDNAGRD